MKTNKDLIFTIFMIFWIILNIIVQILYGIDYIIFSNLFCIIVLSFIIIVKYNNKKFNNWLENER